MAPAGGYKGFGLGLIGETLCAALAGANRGPEMGSFMEDDGLPIGCGQFFVALEPKVFSGGLFDKQVERLIGSIIAQPGARMPNAKREESQKKLMKSGIPIDKALYERIRSFVRK
jgi:(2R)-3-sulfolactate dehydrogenase (NADP+)